MRNIYYLANSIYQFPYAIPIYQRLGGVFVVNSSKKLRHFNKYFQGLACHGEQTKNNTPNALILPRERYKELDGILFFLANTITPEHDYSPSICIFHEHGTSDKLYEGGTAEGLAKLKKYDYILLSGPKNKQRLQEIGIDTQSPRMIEAGALRFDDYLTSKWDKNIECQRLKISDMSRKNILYAPTWKFGNGTLRKNFDDFVSLLDPEYNLIIRPHYHDRKYGYLKYLWARARGFRHVYYSNPADILQRDTYRDFVLSDLMISDMSSVVYEYLITRKPIILIRNNFKKRHSMPAHMDARSCAEELTSTNDLVSLIPKVFAQKSIDDTCYKNLLENCFYRVDGGAADYAADFIHSIR